MYICSRYRGVEQQVARRAHNPKVVGSSPTPATVKAGELPVFYEMNVNVVLWFSGSPGSYPPVGGRRFESYPPVGGQAPATVKAGGLPVFLWKMKDYQRNFVVYVLYSEEYDKIYIGFTSDLSRRIKSHNELSNKGWTKNFRPWKVIYTESYEQKSQALQREKQLKSYRGRKWIREELL